jgi:hypothetical protein
LFSCVSLFGAAEAPPQTDHTATLKKLLDEKRWEEVVEEARTLAVPGIDTDYYHGVALAQLGRWEEARVLFLAALRLEPSDERFPIQLGGVAFKQKRYGEATKWLRRGMRLNPSDTYVTDFLATVYFLQGNLEAALKYWNRIAKPEIESVRSEPGLRIDPLLLDRAFAFAPASTLLLSDFLTSKARVRGLGIFPIHTFHLDGREDGRFDAAFSAHERNGWGRSKGEALLSMFRGVFYQTIYPEYSNVAQSAINIESLARWDAQKRRLLASLSGPFRRDPKRRYRVGLDLRDENWDLWPSFPRSAPLLGALKLYRNALGGEISFFESGNWTWSTGGELSHRDYRDLAERSGFPSDALLTGYQLKHVARLHRELWRVPDCRFESSVRVSSEVGTIWSAPAHSFERLYVSVAARWLPRLAGDDYAMRQQVRAGKIFGRAPFDELFMLGLERDNDLWMRSHIGTRRGRKGSAPLGSAYFLSNWEIDKNLYNNGLLSVKLSPFLDIGKITYRSPGLGSVKWLWDTGIQAKFRVLGVGFVLTYGKDLRSGNHAFYVLAEQ